MKPPSDNPTPQTLEYLRRIDAGERITDIARDMGVGKAAVSLAKVRYRPHLTKNTKPNRAAKRGLTSAPPLA